MREEKQLQEAGEKKDERQTKRAYSTALNASVSSSVAHCDLIVFSRAQ